MARDHLSVWVRLAPQIGVPSVLLQDQLILATPCPAGLSIVSNSVCHGLLFAFSESTLFDLLQGHP